VSKSGWWKRAAAACYSWAQPECDRRKAAREYNGDVERKERKERGKKEKRGRGKGKGKKKKEGKKKKRGRRGKRGEKKKGKGKGVVESYDDYHGQKTAQR